MESEIINNVAALREQRGLSASGLAAAAGISRQAMYAIEAGSYIPNTAVTLRLARELQVSVEELFQLQTEPAEQNRTATATLLDESSSVGIGKPVQLCYVDDRLIATVAAPSAYWLSTADGLVREIGPGKKLRIGLHVEEAALRSRVLLAGCDPAMSLLLRPLQRAGIDLLLAHQNSSEALAALKRGDVHIAGTHLRRSGASDPNLSTIALTFTKDSVAVVSFALWQEGLVTAPGNPKHICSVEDLARRGIRFVNREAGAGCRDLLDTQLAKFGMTGRNVAGYEREAEGHLDAASQVRSGSADCCIATQSAARVFGLDFVPIEEARYDLVLRKESLHTPAVQKLFNVVSLLSFRQELAAASGYDTHVTGGRVL